MKQGIPVVMVDRRIASDKFRDLRHGQRPDGRAALGAMIAEKLHGKGNIIILGAKPDRAPRGPAYARPCRCWINIPTSDPRYVTPI